MTEAQIQDRIRLVLGSDPAGVWWRNNVGTAEIRGYRVAFGIGNPGGADLLGLFRGRFVAVEIKTPTGRQSPEQVRFQKLVEAKGGLYVVLRSEEDAHRLLADLHARWPS